MDSKALLSPEKICAFCAAIGKSCLEGIPVCVDIIIYPFGMRMGSGLIASCLLSRSNLRVILCPIVHVSATDSSSSVRTSLVLE